MRVTRRSLRQLFIAVLSVALLAAVLGLPQGSSAASPGSNGFSPSSYSRADLPAGDRPLENMEKRRVASKDKRLSPAGSGHRVRLNVGLEPGIAELPPVIDLESLGLRRVESLPGLGVEVLELVLPAGTLPSSGLQEPQVPPSDRVGLALRTLREVPGVAFAERDEKQYRPVRTPNDPQFPAQWGAARVRLPEAWDVTTGNPSVTLAVIDTGIVYQLPEFEGRLVSPYRVEDGSQELEDVLDIDGHGTGVAAVAAATGDNGYFMAGAAWDVKIMPVHLTDGPEGSDDATMAKAIAWATTQGADVINISFAGPSPSETVRRAVDNARARDIPIVAAAGNGGPGRGLAFPGGYPGVITVGATDSTNALFSSSQTGYDLDLVAPGVNIVTYVDADPSNSVAEPAWGYVDGTSFSAPLVSGVIALMLSVNPTLTLDQIDAVLASAAVDLGPPGRDASFGHGLLDARRAVELASNPPSTTSTTRPVARFPDVQPTHRYHTQIEELAWRGVVLGKTNGFFEPDSPVARQQFAKMIVLSLGVPVSAAEVNPFGDVDPAPPGALDPLYPDKYVAACATWGITKGTTPGLFSPWTSITRAQLFTMVARSLEGPEPPLGYNPLFANFDSTHYPQARRMQYWGLLEGLGVGPGYTFFQPSTRGEVAALLYNMLQALE